MSQLGIELNLLIAQAINFVIIIFILTKLLYRPIIDMLEKRRKEIAEGLALTEKMRLEDEKLSAKRTKLLEASRGEAQAIITEAKNKANEEAQGIIDQAGLEATAIIERGKADVDLMKKTMEKDMRSQAVLLAVAMAKRLLVAALPSADREKILDQHLKDLEKVDIT